MRGFWFLKGSSFEEVTQLKRSILWLLSIALMGLGCATQPSAPAGPTPTYPRNERGQTYGSALHATSPNTEPDLIQAVGVGGIVGYVRKVDLEEPSPRTPDEALARQRSGTRRARTIPLYAVNGKTVIGLFRIGASTNRGLAGWIWCVTLLGLYLYVCSW